MSEGLPALLAENNDGRQEYDFQFQEQVPVFDIIKIIHELVACVVYTRSVRIHYLRVTGDAWLDIVAKVVIRYDFVECFSKHGTFRARTDQR